MDFDLIRPLISGILGALFASWFFRKLARYAPNSESNFNSEAILKRSRFRRNGAVCLVFAPIAIGIYLYKAELVHTNDWSVSVAAFGLAALLPYLFLLVTSFGPVRPSAHEILLAQAIQSRTPLWMHYGVLILGVFCLVFAIVRWLQAG